MKTAVIKGDNISISWPGLSGQEWRDALEQVKEIPGRRFDAVRRNWTAPVSAEALRLLREYGFSISGDTPEVHAVPAATPDTAGLQKYQRAELLHPYQRHGVGFLLQYPRALLADDMGLGKTAQTIYALALRAAWPALIICPASLKLNWARELQQWAGLQSVVINGTRAQREFGKITIINYDILQSHLPALKARGYQTVVIEECHAIKNPKTARTKAVKAICKGVPNVIAISGTPIVNRPSEFFTVLNILDHYRFPDFWHFAQRYCGARHNGFGWDFSGSSNTEELRAVLDDGLMLRRRKADVLAELPAKTWAVVAFPNRFEDEYRQAREALLQALSGEDRGAAIVMINKPRQIAARAKLADALQWIREVLDSGQKLVVFAVHHFVIDRIMQEFGTAAVKIDGRDSMTARDAAVTAFQTDDGVRLFVGNIQAAGVGITLTAASNVAFLELPWSPGDLEQAVDRCHRIGQRDAVTAWFLIAEGTIEEQMVALLDSKREQLAALLDGQKPAEDTVLALLLAKIKAENN